MYILQINDQHLLFAVGYSLLIAKEFSQKARLTGCNAYQLVHILEPLCSCLCLVIVQIKVGQILLKILGDECGEKATDFVCGRGSTNVHKSVRDSYPS